tara:strand:- start:12148 stop:12807 length:660 start_codon:yes stop_codon:yes gene_type:complete
MQDFNEIQVAKRVTKKTRKIKSYFFTTILIIFIFIVIDGLYKQRFTNQSLLGHLPYKEALSEDLVTINEHLKVHKNMYEYLIKMQNAAREENIKLVFLSGFRSKRLQHEIFYEIKSIRNQAAYKRAEVSAPPGYSEHSTGFAIDIGDGDSPEYHFEEGFESTNAFKWLIKNAHKYHFLMSFPRDNPQGVSYEPWHWRFEGSDDALQKFEESNKLFRKAN